MKKLFLALAGLTSLVFVSCRKNTDTMPAAAGQQPVAEAIYYDFVVSVNTGCPASVLTINDCGDASYKPWYSTASCTGKNVFNGTVAGSGNPLLNSNAPTFPNLGATYLIFDNSTTATRDVLSVTFYPGYNASHKPTISYNAGTRKFTILNAGNTAYVSVSKFSYTGLIAAGVIEFC